MPEAARHPFHGVLLMLLALFFFAALDATAKHLVVTFAVPLLVWARFTLHCLLMVVFLAPSMRGKLLATKRPLIQVIRALLLLGVSLFALAALRLMPLAETTAILYVTPLLVVLLSGPFLGERVSLRRWASVATGFAGALLIARPGGALSGLGILFSLAAALCYSVYQIQTRQLSSTESAVTMLFYTALTGTAAMSLALPWFWSGPMPSPQQALLIASLGISGGGRTFPADAGLPPHPGLDPVALDVCPVDLGNAAGLAVVRPIARSPLHPRHAGHRRQRPVHRALREPPRHGESRRAVKPCPRHKPEG